MIRNYETPEGTIALINSTSVTVPVKVFTSSTTGGPVGGGVTGQTMAVTTIAFCNTSAPSASDETTNAVIVNVYLVKSGRSFGNGNLIVNSLTVPAGETVFFNDERIILDSADEIWVGTSTASRLSVTVSALPV
jgi:hypothetical protein